MKSKGTIEFRQVFEADLDELRAMQGHPFINEEAEVYSTVMMAYHTNDPAKLKDLLVTIETLNAEGRTSRAMLLCTRMRLETLLCQFEKQTRAEMEKESDENPAWRGEVEFLLAIAAETVREDERCVRHNQKARVALLDIGAKRKSVKALVNQIIAKTRLHPESYHISDFLYAYRKAKQIHDHSLMAVMLLNLSREYQKVGAISVAFQYANRAVLVGSKNAGNLAYYKALLQRCNLYMHSGCATEARSDVESALTCKAPVIQAAVEKIREKYPELLQHAPASDGEKAGNPMLVTAFWQSRSEKVKFAPMGKLEELLIVFLSDGPKSKEEIMAHLYGIKISQESADNRLRNLLCRIRKRNKNLIKLVNGYYRLSEEPFSSKNKTAA